MAVKIDGDGVMTGVASIGPFDQGGQRNRLINGNNAINQLAKTGTVTLAAGAYGHDGWKAGAAGCTYTFAPAGKDVVITIVTGSLIQVVDPDEVEGGNYVAAWSGTAQAKFNGGAFGASPIKATGVIALGTLSIEFGVGSMGLVTVEPGLFANPFERRRRGLELLLCQRYYEEIDGGGTYNGAGSTGIAFPAVNYTGGPPVSTVYFRATKRAIPQVTFVNAGTVRYVCSSGVVSGGTPQCGGANLDLMTLTCTHSVPAGYGFMDGVGKIQIAARL